MRNNGVYEFGPRLRKPTIKKKPTKLMKKSLKQLRKTRECYTSVRIRYNSDNKQGDDDVGVKRDQENKVVPQKTQQTPLEEPSHITVVPWTKNLTFPSRINNGMTSTPKNIEKSRLSPSRILQKNTVMSRPSSSKTNNDIVSFRRTTVSSSSQNDSIVCLQNVVKKSRQSSSRQDNGRHPLSNMDRDAESMNKHIHVDSRKQKTGLSQDGGTHVDKFKSTMMEPLLEGKLETHRGVDIRRSMKTRKRFIIVHGDNEDDDERAENLACAKKGIARFTKSMDCSIQTENQNTSLAEDGRIIDGKVRKRADPLSLETHEDNDSQEADNCRPTRRRRRLTLNVCEDDDDGDQNLAGIEIGTVGLITTQTAVVKDYSTKVSNSFLSESLKLQHSGSRPIDEPVWSGTIKISNNKSVSLAAHVSTKCCEEALKLAGSLQPEIVATKLSRLEAWPKSFEASRPTDNDIALYFFSCEMRQDADLDQLVKEVVENDMVLQAVIGEVEMLIFPSILLPEQQQTFQGKPYLWAVFKRRKIKDATVEAQQHGKGRCVQDVMEKQQQSSLCTVGKEGHMVTGLNTDVGLEAPKEVKRQGTEHEQNPSLARANAPVPATRAPTMDATMSANHGQIHSSLAIPTGALFGFVAQRTPRLEKLIQELQREGALVVAMQGEMIGSGNAQETITGREEDEMPPSSSGRVAVV